MATREFAAVFARLAADRTGLAKDLQAAVKDSERAGSEMEKGFQRPFTKGFVSGIKDADSAVSALGGKVGGMVATLTNPWALGAAAVGGLVTALTYAVTKGIEFDREFQKIAVLLKEGADTDGLRAQLLALPAELGSTTEAMGVFRTALIEVGDTDAALELTKVSLALGKISGQDPKAIAATIANLSDSLNLSAKNAARVADVLFQVQQMGGGSAADIAGKVNQMADALALLGKEGVPALLDVGSAFTGFSKLSGQSSDAVSTAVSKMIVGVTGNLGKFKELGVDIRGLVEQNGAVVGSLKALQEASGGSREKLTELGVPAKNVQLILKAMSDEGLRTIREDFKALEAAKPGLVFSRLAQQSKSVSGELDRLGISVEKLGQTAGDTILGFFRDKGPLPLTKRLEELNAEMATLERASAGALTFKQKESIEAQKTSLQERIDAVKTLLAAVEDADKKQTESAQKRDAFEDGTSFKQDARARELLALERKITTEREGLAADRRALVVKFLADEAAAEADSARDRIAIRRQEAIESGRIEDDRLLDRRRALEREADIVRASKGDEQDRQQKLLELRQQLDQVDDQLAKNQEARASRLRMLAAEDRRQRLADEDKAFQVRRALGEASLRDEIFRLKQISTESRRTSDERLNALVAVFEKEKQLREQSRSAALGLIGEVQKSFEAQGRSTEDVTAFEFEQELDRIRTMKEQLVASSQTSWIIGGGQSLDALKQAVTFAGELEQTQTRMRELGGVSSVFTQAFATGGEAQQNINAFRQIYIDATTAMLQNTERLKTGFVDAMSSAAQTVDQYMSTIEARVSQGNGIIVRGIIDAVKLDIARELDREAKRF
jgi:TP901 family phage tail tape measure protein